MVVLETSEVNLIVSTTKLCLANPYLLEECDDYIDASDPNADGYDYFNLSTIDNLITQPFPLGNLTRLLIMKQK